MTQPEYQPPATPTTPAPAYGTPEVLTQAHPVQPEGAPAVSGASHGSAAGVSRGLLVAAWVGAVSLALLALVAVVWTVELIRIQMELQDAARSVRDYIAHLGAGLGGGGTTDCPNGEPFC
jgi:hypothetical protein